MLRSAGRDETAQKSRGVLGKDLTSAVLAGLALLLVAAAIGGLGTTAGASGRVLARGRFHAVAHRGSGVATIYELPNGLRRLHLSELKTDVRPDLEVCLVAAQDALDNESVEARGFVSLGTFGDSTANPTFEIPDTVDLSRYRAVTIWSVKYRVNFTTAPLTVP